MKTIHEDNKLRVQIGKSGDVFVESKLETLPKPTRVRITADENEVGLRVRGTRKGSWRTDNTLDSMYGGKPDIIISAGRSK